MALYKHAVVQAEPWQLQGLYQRQAGDDNMIRVARACVRNTGKASDTKLSNLSI